MKCSLKGWFIWGKCQSPMAKIYPQFVKFFQISVYKSRCSHLQNKRAFPIVMTVGICNMTASYLSRASNILPLASIWWHSDTIHRRQASSILCTWDISPWTTREDDTTPDLWQETCQNRFCSMRLYHSRSGIIVAYHFSVGESDPDEFLFCSCAYLFVLHGHHILFVIHFHGVVQ